MYFASLLFCWVSINGPQCLVAEDTYGPWKTNRECHLRIEQMADRIREEMPFADVRGRHCHQMKIGADI